jgi:hypothetical protein
VERVRFCCFKDWWNQVVVIKQLLDMSMLVRLACVLLMSLLAVKQGYGLPVCCFCLWIGPAAVWTWHGL